MPRRLILAWAVVALSALPVKAQAPFPRDILPTRTTLGRLGLERQWAAVVPMTGDERLLGVSLADGLIFAQTNKGNFHTFDAETGSLNWSVRLGNVSSRIRPASVNSFAVFVTNVNYLVALDRRTGTRLWSTELPSLPSSSTACDEDRVMVGLASGKIYAFTLKTTKGGVERIAGEAIPAWNWQTGGPVESRPLPAGKFVAFGSDDGKAYVSTAVEKSMLYRIATGGPIGAGFGTFGTRTLLVPSSDRNLYAVDLMTSQVLWTYAAGETLRQEPLVTGNDLFSISVTGHLVSLDPTTGSVRWSLSTNDGRLISASAKRIYLESIDGDLFVVDRATGQMIADPQATYQRVGLNLRPYELGLTNRLNDRLYFATPSGLVISIRETAQTAPFLTTDPKARPFGYVPPEGISLVPKSPPRAPVATPEEAPPAEGDKPAAEADMPAGDKPK